MSWMAGMSLAHLRVSMLNFPPNRVQGAGSGRGGVLPMFELTHGSSRSCDGVSRRNFLRVGSLTALGLSLPDLLRARARAASQGNGGAAGSSADVSCILIWLQGGISHIDSFDPKPDAPV